MMESVLILIWAFLPVILAFGGMFVLFLIGFKLVFGSEPRDD